jgi:hypothetical protein
MCTIYIISSYISEGDEKSRGIQSPEAHSTVTKANEAARRLLDFYSDKGNQLVELQDYSVQYKVNSQGCFEGKLEKNDSQLVASIRVHKVELDNVHNGTIKQEA